MNQQVTCLPKVTSDIVKTKTCVFIAPIPFLTTLLSFDVLNYSQLDFSLTFLSSKPYSFHFSIATYHSNRKNVAAASSKCILNNCRSSPRPRH